VEPDSVLFPNRTSQNISALLQQSTEFVNTGVPAYMTWQQLILLQREGMRYDPDLLVLGFVLNDVSEQIDYAFWQNDKMRSNATLSWIDRWAQRSALVWIAQVIGRRVRIGDIDLEAKQVSDVKRLIEEANHPDVQQAWQDTFAALDEMVAFCATNDLPLVLVVFPFKFQLEDPNRFDLPHEQLAAYAQQQDLPYLDLLPPLAQHVRARNLSPDALFLDIDHLTVRGHEVVAQLLAQFLAEQGLLASTANPPSNEQARRPESASPVEQILDP
jgi:hypothetical protein